MKAIETTVTVTADGKVTVQLPPDISPGKYQVVLVINEKPVNQEKPQQLDFPMIHVNSWPADLYVRREDIYGDDGR